MGAYCHVHDPEDKLTSLIKAKLNSKFAGLILVSLSPGDIADLVKNTNHHHHRHHHKYNDKWS